MKLVPELEERVVLVDRQDREVGTAGKLDAHRAASLHRAFSVFVMNSRGELLLQRRARGKYHTPGLWSNTACGHPRPGEAVEAAAARRLEEEMGFVCPLERLYGFVHRADLGNDLTEHEYDHVFVGTFDGVPSPDPLEVEACRWADPRGVARDIALRGYIYTPWFRLALPELLWRTMEETPQRAMIPVMPD